MTQWRNNSCKINICGVLGAVRCYDEDGGEYPCGVPTTYHGKTAETASQRVMGDTGDQGGANFGVHAVGSHSHRLLSSIGITVGVPMTTIGCIRALN